MRRGRAADPPAEPLRVRVELARDLVVALASLQQDEALDELRAVLLERPDLDGAARRGRSWPGTDDRRSAPRSAPPGPSAGLGRLDSEDGERDDAPAVQEQDPPDRSPEEQFAAAIVEPGVPAHLLRERHVAQHAGQRLGQHVDRRVAALESAVARGRRPSASPVARAPRPRRRASCANPSAAGVGSPVGLNAAVTAGPLITSSRSACRSGIRATRAVRRRGVLNVSTGASGGNRRARQARRQVVAELPGQRRQPGGGQFLGSEFDQKLAVHNSRRSCRRSGGPLRPPGWSPIPARSGASSPRRRPAPRRPPAAAPSGCRRSARSRPTPPDESSTLNRCEHFRHCS